MLKLQQVMTVGNYSPRSIGNYLREMRFIFEYYPDTLPSKLTAEQIELYICYIKKVFNSGFSKCRLVASSVSFFLSKFSSALTIFLPNFIHAKVLSCPM